MPAEYACRQDVSIGPFKALNTASALSADGTVTIAAGTFIISDIVSVIAWVGTSASEATVVDLLFPAGLVKLDDLRFWGLQNRLPEGR